MWNIFSKKWMRHIYLMFTEKSVSKHTKVHLNIQRAKKHFSNHKHHSAFIEKVESCRTGLSHTTERLTNLVHKYHRLLRNQMQPIQFGKPRGRTMKTMVRRTLTLTCQ